MSWLDIFDPDAIVQKIDDLEQALDDVVESVDSATEKIENAAGAIMEAPAHVEGSGLATEAGSKPDK